MDRSDLPHASASDVDATSRRANDARTHCFADIEAVLPLWSDERLANDLDHALRDWNGRDDIWVFAYGSLIWKPDLTISETRRAKVYGLHRSLCLWSTVNRGTPQCPGLVLALDAGGSCEGLAYRVAADAVHAEFARLWRREMARGSYRPTWLKAHTSQGAIRALAFVMDRTRASYAGRLEDPHVLDVLRRACGRYGTTADYVRCTVRALRERELSDPRLERWLALFDASPTDPS